MRQRLSGAALPPMYRRFGVRRLLFSEMGLMDGHILAESQFFLDLAARSRMLNHID